MNETGARVPLLIVGTLLVAIIITLIDGQETAKSQRDDYRRSLEQATSQPIPTVTQRVTSPPRTVIKTVIVERDVERSSRNLSRSGRPSKTVGTYQAWARDRVSAAQWPCLRELWDRESKWSPTSDNPHSSAYGIPQIIGMKPGTGWQRQIERGLSYIDNRYGTPCAALAFHDRKNWY